MAYVKPIIRVRENDRFINRGTYYDKEIGRHCLQATEDETTKVKLDYTDILDSSTITIATSANGLTVASTSSGGIVTLTLSAVATTADLDVTTTFSDGRIRQDFIRVYNPFVWAKDDYGPVLAQP